MSREERKLRKHTEAHASRELKKERAKLRKADTPKSKPVRPRWHPGLDFEEDFNEEIRKRPATKERRDAELFAGLVVETGAGFCDVLCQELRVRCRAETDVAAGDRVMIAVEKRRIEQILPRRTALSRTDPHNSRVERVLAANIDVVVNVVSLKSPPLRPGLIDRYLIAIDRSGAAPLICINKIDLLESDGDLDALRPYYEMGIAVVLCSAATGAGIDALADALAGQICVFSGHSGVGKSSILNALDPELRLATGSVSHANMRGRHTTTGSSLHRLPNGAMIIDTPGIREFGLWRVTATDVRHYFRDLAEYAGQCAFSDCTHLHEPNCAVKQAVAAARVSEARYAGYRRIMDSLR